MSLRIWMARSVSSIDRPCVGSSSMRSRGCCAIAIATSKQALIAVRQHRRRHVRRTASAAAAPAPRRQSQSSGRSPRRRRRSASAAGRAPAPRSRTFSRAVSAGKTWQSWNVRAMPFCAVTCTGSPVIVSPANDTSPAVGLSVPVIRLNSVDLPAPFGPITARISPGSTVMSTLSTATSAPNRRVRPLHSSSGIGRLLAAAGIGGSLRRLLQPAGEDAPDALRRQHDEGDEDRTEDQRPQVGDLRKLMFEIDEAPRRR